MNPRLTCVGWLALLCLPARIAQAHWCDDLWGSSYNLAVRPETDTVAVPEAGPARLSISVQNNMAYPLPHFALEASATGYAIQSTMGSTKVRDMLMPGERIVVVLTIAASGGATLSVTDIVFHVHFGSNRQADRYPTAPGRAAVLLGPDGGVLDPAFPGMGTGNAEARDLQYAAMVDFGDTTRGVDSLLQFYCAGRASWDHSSERVLAANCLDVDSTQCPERATFVAGAGTTLYDWPRLWAAEHLAARKAAASARLPVFRQRLMCGYADDNPPFRIMAAVLLGYLGEDPATRAFLEAKLRATNSNEHLAIKAALLLLGNAEDLAQYRDEVARGLDSDDPYLAGACAAVLGIVERNDQAVQEILMMRATWTEPELADNGCGFFHAHLLALVAAHRSGWTAGGGQPGYPSFFAGETIEKPVPVIPPAEPVDTSTTGCSCSTSGGGGRASLPVVALALAILGVRWRRTFWAWRFSLAALALFAFACSCNSSLRRAQHFNQYATDADSQPDQVLAHLAITPGTCIADIGAGGGYFTLQMARATGPAGKVYAVDIDAGLLAVIERQAAEASLANVQPVLASEDDSRLPDASVDLVFMRDTFHHLADATTYFRKLASKLRPGARVAIIDYRPESLWARIFGHHASEDTIKQQLTRAGYTMWRSHAFLSRQCFVIFTYAPVPDPTAQGSF
jgi:MYXO-CTERM domain-containing protein